MGNKLNMNFFKKLVIDFSYKLHVRNTEVLMGNKIIEINNFNHKNAIIGIHTRIFEEAKICNHLNDRTKIVIGENTDIRGELMLFGHAGEIIIGDYCFVGENSKIWSAKKIVIGNRVLISHNVNIHDNNSHPTDKNLRHEDFKHIKNLGLQKINDLNEKQVIIGDDCWIGFNSTILKGVTIGKSVIIGANTLVTKDVPDFAVCVGNPMKIIKYSK
ncbi:acyltransferase [Flavobacterium sp.]|uniref:acyltransferase n=1 Tax=Flavobacterium sp. TaxID=239 RepID=UPI003753C859